MSKKGQVKFKPTDGLTNMLTTIVRDYYEEKGEPASKKLVRDQRKKLLGAIKSGTRSINLSKVKARDPVDV